MRAVPTVKALAQAAERLTSGTAQPGGKSFIKANLTSLTPCSGLYHSHIGLSQPNSVHTSAHRTLQPGAAEQGGRFSTAALTLKPLVTPEEYFEEQRKARGSFNKLSHKALLVDAAGTLLEPTEPVTQVYLEFGRKYGVRYSEEEILMRYRHAYAQPWCQSILRYVDDGRPFWHHILSQATGCSDPKYSEEVYQYYTTAAAWRVTDPGAEAVFQSLRRAGVKLAVVSNFDTRLRPVLRALHCDHWFDALAISAEVQAEKPNPTLFSAACELLGVQPCEAVHVGDDRRNDVWGARDAGCDAWLWGGDVLSFREVAERIGVRVGETPSSS